MNEFGDILAGLFCYTIFILLPGAAISVVGHYLLSLPMRRRDCALFFLDLIETALLRGQSVEQAIISAAESRDPAPGINFYVLAAHIESGLPFGAALKQTPNFLPPAISAILRAGEKLGDLKSVLPACRENLRIAPETLRSSVQYMVTLLLVFSPIMVFTVGWSTQMVVPRFKDVMAGMGVAVWPVSKFVFDFVPALVGYEIVLFLVLMVIAIFYIAGPGLIRRFYFRRFPLADWIAWRIPWKQKRLQRTFSAMLAVLLDGGVPETEAVRLAGDCTANEMCRRRAARVISAITQGVKLDEAVRVFDDSGEFHWRFTNAVHAHGGFLKALHGWHEVLDAKAFQQEETTAHVVTSGLVILNGLVVALIATALFGGLVAILNGLLSTL